jgi:uncharacterized membrane protein YozB (DUF420 family)
MTAMTTMTVPPLLAVHPLATTNAVLNAIATALLVAGWVFIRRGEWRAHRFAMMAAFAVSTLFLVCYLSYHYLVGHVPFAGQGTARTVYFAILVSHIVLAVLVPFLAIAMFLLAFRGKWAAHRALGRVTMPIWLYVSITGVVIYMLLYHVYPRPVAASMIEARSGPIPGPRLESSPSPARDTATAARPAEDATWSEATAKTTAGSGPAAVGDPDRGPAPDRSRGL